MPHSKKISLRIVHEVNGVLRKCFILEISSMDTFNLILRPLSVTEKIKVRFI